MEIKNGRLAKLPEKRALSIFCTAGYPRLGDTVEILKRLEKTGVDMIEIGFPFSDPVADGPVIQESNRVAIENGMNLSVLFDQLIDIRSVVSIPLLLMGYLNPIEQYGVERFLKDAARCGIDGVILPDLPFDEYLERYKPLFIRFGIAPVFLVTTRTSPERIRAFDRESPAFLYLLSSDAVTGGALQVSNDRESFFKRVSEMQLASRLIVGFGVGNRDSFEAVTRHTNGAIVGSAFLRAIAQAPIASSLISDAAGRSVVNSDFESDNLIEKFIGGLR